MINSTKPANAAIFLNISFVFIHFSTPYLRCRRIKLAMSWVKTYCKEGIDVNAPENQRSPEEREKLWEDVVKMTIVP